MGLIKSLKELKFLLSLYNKKTLLQNNGTILKQAKFYRFRKTLIKEGVLIPFLVANNGKVVKAYRINHHLLDIILLAEEFPILWERAVNHCAIPRPKPRDKHVRV